MTERGSRCLGLSIVSAVLLYNAGPFVGWSVSAADRDERIGFALAAAVCVLVAASLLRPQVAEGIDDFVDGDPPG